MDIEFRGGSFVSLKDLEIPRDKGRPVINGKPYSRVSTVAGHINSMAGLGVWKQRHIALAVARRPDIQQELCMLTYEDKTRVDGLIEEALMRARDDEGNGKLLAARRGTVFHDATVVQGLPMPEPYQVASDGFFEALDRYGLEVVDTEVFVVNDRLEVAGTYDHKVVHRVTGRAYILDKKTGGKYWTVHAAQLDGYAGSVAYDHVNDVRMDLGVERDMGLIAHTDLVTGLTEISTVDLSWRPMDIAAAAHKAGSAANVKRIIGKLPEAVR